MRLVCPSCAAEYEVDGAAIPPEGRDVQCSNCGHTWLQHPEGHEPPETGKRPPADEPEDAMAEAEDAIAEAEDADDDDLSDAGTNDPEPPATARQPEATADEVSEADATDDEATEQADLDAELRDLSARQQSAEPLTEPEMVPETEAAQEPASARRPPLDPAVIAILREEAEREVRVRREEREASLETQPDLGLLVQPKYTGDAASEAGPAMAAAPRRPEGSNRGRDRLPDIEEYDSGHPPPAAAHAANSWSMRGTVDAEADPGRSGFRAGFLLAMLVFAVLAAVYGLSDALAETAPAAQPVLAAFTEAVDNARIQLDAAMRAAVDGITTLIARLRT